MQNFTLIDVESAILASALFSFFMVPPGYVIGWSTNLFSFRDRLIGTRLLLAIAISASVTPAAAYWIGRVGSLTEIWTVVAPLTAVAAAVGVCEWRSGRRRGFGLPAVAMIIASVWCVIAIGSLIDLQLGDRLY